MGRAVTQRLEVDGDAEDTARRLHAQVLGGFDALHIALAIRARVDAFLTTDDRLVRRALRLGNQVPITVALPLGWIESTLNKGSEP